MCAYAFPPSIRKDLPSAAAIKNGMPPINCDINRSQSIGHHSILTLVSLLPFPDFPFPRSADRVNSHLLAG